MPDPSFEIGIDIGGTFTDVVCRQPDGSLRQFKLPTTRANPADAVRDALAYMIRNWGIRPSQIARFVHGTTIAVHCVPAALRRGARPRRARAIAATR